MSALEEFPTTISREMFKLLCGQRLGRGISREVFVFKPDPTLVLKIEATGSQFQNAMEWETWQQVQHIKSIAAWFAPCINISPYGAIMLQKRTMPAPETRFPKRVPTVFTDLTRENWGLLGNRLVCHDYGNNLAMANGFSTKTHAADWWGGD
jgi:hypothetical protein